MECIYAIHIAMHKKMGEGRTINLKPRANKKILPWIQNIAGVWILGVFHTFGFQNLDCFLRFG